jgi:hypothetical protein
LDPEVLSIEIVAVQEPAGSSKSHSAIAAVVGKSNIIDRKTQRIYSPPIVIADDIAFLEFGTLAKWGITSRAWALSPFGQEP